MKDLKFLYNVDKTKDKAPVFWIGIKLVDVQVLLIEWTNVIYEWVVKQVNEQNLDGNYDFSG